MQPRTIDEAVEAAEAWPDAAFLSGGTDFMVEVNFGHRSPDRVIALRRVTELTEWNDRRIGAGATWSSLESSPHEGLAQAARTVGSPQIRNAGTIGGNLGTASPAGDGLPFLAAVDASIELVSAGGTRVLSWREFLVGVKKNAATSGELISAVHLPDDMPVGQAFGKIGVRSAMVIATVCACVVRFESGQVRVALGSVAPTVMRARDAENMISSPREPSEGDLAEFQRLVSEAVQPITDHRSTAGYRRHAAGVLARRLLERILEKKV